MQLATISYEGVPIAKNVWTAIDPISWPWTGFFHLPEPAKVKAGDRCLMETLDGKRATIVLHSTKPADRLTTGRPHPKIHVTFVFEGSLWKPVERFVGG